jgi:exonuclease III
VSRDNHFKPSQLDHVLLSPGLLARVEQDSVRVRHDVRSSDHFPLVFTLRLDGGGRGNRREL